VHSSGLPNYGKNSLVKCFHLCRSSLGSILNQMRFSVTLQNITSRTKNKAWSWPTQVNTYRDITITWWTRLCRHANVISSIRTPLHSTPGCKQWGRRLGLSLDSSCCWWMMMTKTTIKHDDHTIKKSGNSIMKYAIVLYVY
jgi:hypothetical protein